MQLNIQPDEIVLRLPEHDEAYGLCKIVAAGSSVNNLGGLGYISISEIKKEGTQTRTEGEYIIVNSKNILENKS